MSTIDYARIEDAINYLSRHFRRQPDLQEIARQVNLSEYHFQRLFRRWAGISPKRFVQFLTVGYAKKLLRDSADMLQATFESGLSSPGRLHDLFVNTEAMTPGEFKQKGAGLTIHYGFHATPFGECLVATTDRGICALSFCTAGEQRRAVAALKKNWLGAKLVEKKNVTQPLVEQIFTPLTRQNGQKLGLLLAGTNFQIKVWEALLKIPPGFVLAYDDVAALIGKPRAARAVGNAIAQNPIGYLIPCHRVIRKAGVVGDYRWGQARKRAMLAWEAAKKMN
jgi:AraC family transcriptional regulator of adaptative response/methylated-DNA-[protein]-cysteine methyltransferase